MSVNLETTFVGAMAPFGVTGVIAHGLGQLVTGCSVICLAGRAFPSHVSRSPSPQE